jgi:hypothetical protein
LAILGIEQPWMPNEQLRGRRCEQRSPSMLPQVTKNRSYNPPAVVSQHVQAIREQRPYGFSIDLHVILRNVRRPRKAADAREAECSKQADEHQPKSISQGCTENRGEAGNAW